MVMEMRGPDASGPIEIERLNKARVACAEIVEKARQQLSYKCTCLADTREAPEIMAQVHRVTDEAHRYGALLELNALLYPEAKTEG